LRIDKASPHGLSFNVREDAEIIHAPILDAETGKFSSGDVDNKTGLPMKLGDGDRTFYTRQNGLSRLDLGWYLDLGSVWGGGDDLSDSYGDGRVVVVRAAEGGPSKI